MPLVKIYPGIPSFTKGLTLFSRKPAWSSASRVPGAQSYLQMLDDHGYGLSQPIGGGNGADGCLVMAYQADSFPSDSFTNEYGENFLQGLTSVGSEAAASLAQIRGARNMGQVFDAVTGDISKMGEWGEFAAGALQAGGQMLGNTARALLPKAVTGGIDVVSKLMAGSRIDFPMVWKSSSFQPSYTMTIRLYNPNPASESATKKYIAAPIAAIMLLGVPVSDDGITYSWPFIHKITSPGIYNLEPAFISNITIIKGGDQQQIAYNQRLGVVDIRIDFGSLFSSMLSSPNAGGGKTRPTLNSYLDAITGTDSSKEVENFSTTPLQITPAEQAEFERQRISSRNILLKKKSLKEQAEENRARVLARTARQSATQSELTDEEKDNPPNRVNRSLVAIQDDLESRIPGFLQ